MGTKSDNKTEKGSNNNYNNKLNLWLTAPKGATLVN